MGLDSVELLMEFEDYFSIAIPDLEAEKISTVQDMINSVSNHLTVTDEYSIDHKKEVLDKLGASIKLSGSEFVFLSYLPSDKEFWKSLEINSGLLLPLPSWNQGAHNNVISKVWNSIKVNFQYDWKTVTLDRFCEVVCFANHEKLIGSRPVQDKFEIYMAISGITEDKIGIEFYEIFPDKTFTGDFGID